MDVSVPRLICIFIGIHLSFFIVHYSAVYLHNHPEHSVISSLVGAFLFPLFDIALLSIIMAWHLPTDEREYNLFNAIDAALYRHLPTVRRCAAAAFLSL